MDHTKTREALDAFEKEDFIKAREILSKEIQNAKSDFLRNKLNLKGAVSESDNWVAVKKGESPASDAPRMSKEDAQARADAFAKRNNEE
jgi:hypothetical protein